VQGGTPEAARERAPGAAGSPIAQRKSRRVITRERPWQIALATARSGYPSGGAAGRSAARGAVTTFLDRQVDTQFDLCVHIMHRNRPRGFRSVGIVRLRLPRTRGSIGGTNAATVSKPDVPGDCQVTTIGRADGGSRAILERLH
jgi:hypothetical protein